MTRPQKKPNYILDNLMKQEVLKLQWTGMPITGPKKQNCFGARGT